MVAARKQLKDKVPETKEEWKAEEYEAYKTLTKDMEVSFKDGDLESHEKVREFFNISKDKQAVDDMNEKVFDMLYQRMQNRQINFYAFLNKEFNIMNYKSARCSMHCFDNEDTPIVDVNSCLKICRSGI